MSERQRTADAVLIPLDRLVPDDYFQPRFGGLSEEHVKLLMQTDPATWPPLVVTPNDSGGFDLIDGFHRYHAARRLDLSALSCRIDPDADYFTGVAANVTHGLPLSMADRKEAARWLAEHEPQLSYRDIGRRVGLNHETVKRALTEPERAARPSTATDPVARFVRQVYRFVERGDLGSASLRREIATYDAASQPDIATALNEFGRACVAAAAPYLTDGG